MPQLSSKRSITVSIESAGKLSLSELAGEWHHLEQRASCSFFQSWFWIEIFLRRVSTEMWLIRMFQDDSLVALGILVASTAQRPLGGAFQVIGLNEAPATDLSKISVEYNGLLCEAGLEDSVHQRLIEFLVQEQSAFTEWRECRLPGCGPGVMDAVQGHAKTWRLYRKNSAPYVKIHESFVDLDAYLGGLSKNTRHQVKRSLRMYEALGPLSLVRPNDADAAAGAMSRLIELHQAQWEARGESGAFANTAFREFHFDLLKKHFESGVIDLVEVHAGERVVGVLYNFIYAGTALSYQSGFRYESDNRMKPGLVCHALAVSDYAAKTVETYKFLAGDQRYKKSLSNGADELYWIAIQRPDLRMRLENALRSVKTRFR